MDRIRANLWMLASGLFAVLTLVLFVFTVNQTVALDGLRAGPFRMIGVREKLSICEADLARAGEDLKAEQDVRVREVKTAQETYDAKAIQCRADVAAARASGRMIEKVTYVESDPVTDADPTGGIIGARELRVIYGYPAEPDAGGLPAERHVPDPLGAGRVGEGGHPQAEDG